MTFSITQLTNVLVAGVNGMFMLCVWDWCNRGRTMHALFWLTPQQGMHPVAPTPFLSWCRVCCLSSGLCCAVSYSLLHPPSTYFLNYCLVCAPITMHNNDIIASNHSTDLDSIVLSSSEGDVETPSYNELANIPCKHAPLRRLSTFSKKVWHERRWGLGCRRKSHAQYGRPS